MSFRLALVGFLLCLRRKKRYVPANDEELIGQQGKVSYLLSAFNLKKRKLVFQVFKSLWASHFVS